MEEAQILEGVVKKLSYKKEHSDFVAFSVNTGSEEVEAVGAAGEVYIGEIVKLEGHFETHSIYGRQFKITSCVPYVPQEVQDIEAYLTNGALPYISQAVAKEIMTMFGSDALDVIAEHPEQLTAIRGLNEEKANAIHQEFRRQFGAREVVTWLGKYRISAPRA